MIDNSSMLWYPDGLPAGPSRQNTLRPYCLSLASNKNMYYGCIFSVVVGATGIWHHFGKHLTCQTNMCKWIFNYGYAIFKVCLGQDGVQFFRCNWALNRATQKSHSKTFLWCATSIKDMYLGCIFTVAIIAIRIWHTILESIDKPNKHVRLDFWSPRVYHKYTLGCPQVTS